MFSLLPETEFVLVRSKNFQFVGEASEEKIRREAFRLEQFREVVRRAFPELNVGRARAPPTVLLFKDSEVLRRLSRSVKTV